MARSPGAAPGKMSFGDSSARLVPSVCKISGKDWKLVEKMGLEPTT